MHACTNECMPVHMYVGRYICISAWMQHIHEIIRNALARRPVSRSFLYTYTCRHVGTGIHIHALKKRPNQHAYHNISAHTCMHTYTPTPTKLSYIHTNTYIKAYMHPWMQENIFSTGPTTRSADQLPCIALQCATVYM